MFDKDEIHALVLGARIVAQFSDPALAREAVVAQRRLRLNHANGKGEESERTIRPLGVFFWGKTWTLAAGCEMRIGFRNFRLDRISRARIGERFDEEPRRTLRDMLAQYRPSCGPIARLTTDARAWKSERHAASWLARTHTRARAASARCRPSP